MTTVALVLIVIGLFIIGERIGKTNELLAMIINRQEEEDRRYGGK